MLAKIRNNPKHLLDLSITNAIVPKPIRRNNHPGTPNRAITPARRQWVPPTNFAYSDDAGIEAKLRLAEFAVSFYWSHNR